MEIKKEYQSIVKINQINYKKFRAIRIKKRKKHQKCDIVRLKSR